MTNALLALNVGSSTLKFGLFEAARSANPALSAILRGRLEQSEAGGELHVVDAAEQPYPAAAAIGSVSPQDDAFFTRLLGWIESEGWRVLAVGHRVVHGGTEFSAPVRVDDGILARLDRLAALAPLHQSHNLRPIRVLAKARPAMPQVACFDTAFHRNREPVTMRFALPREYEAAGVLRYGFHGLSYEYVAGVLAVVDAPLARGRLIIAHLGNGASLCGVHQGRSVDTTMSFTALDGLAMGTRPGSLDPGVILYLLKERGMSPAEIEDLLYHRSGLLGVSGISGDMRALLSSDRPEAADAVELFSHRVAREIGALAATLGGLDGLVFTAGIGEHSPEIRHRIAARCAWLGVVLSENANATGGLHRIDAAGSRIPVWIVPTDEEMMIARHALAVVDAAA